MYNVDCTYRKQRWELDRGKERIDNRDRESYRGKQRIDTKYWELYRKIG